MVNLLVGFGDTRGDLAPGGGHGGPDLKGEEGYQSLAGVELDGPAIQKLKSAHTHMLTSSSCWSCIQFSIFMVMVCERGLIWL